jgi:hypothetical protein
MLAEHTISTFRSSHGFDSSPWLLVYCLILTKQHIYQASAQYDSINMVLGIAMMAGMLPTMIGLNEATKGARDREESRREDARRTRTPLMAVCDVDEGSLAQRQQVHNAKVYLGLDRRVLCPE